MSPRAMAQPFDPNPRLAATAATSEALLLAATARGDSKAFGQLVTTHLGAMLGIARRMLGVAAEAEDVAQEAMLRLWRSGVDSNWRASLQSVQTGERHMFADLDSLLAFLVEQSRSQFIPQLEFTFRVDNFRQLFFENVRNQLTKIANRHL